MFYIKRAVIALGLVIALSCTVLGRRWHEEFGLNGEETLFELGSKLRMIGI